MIRSIHLYLDAQMKFIMLPLLVCCLLTGCSYSVTSHRTDYHGTDFPASQEDFYYVSFGVFGMSSAIYDLRGGGHVRQGLIADAKADMRINHPLTKNQTYANLSIDIMETESGSQWQGSRVAKMLELTAVVTADIIQFGEPSESKTAENTGRLSSTYEQSSAGFTTKTKLLNQINDNKFEEGDKVIVEFGGRPIEAIIKAVTWVSEQETFEYLCEYKTNSGTARTTERIEAEINAADSIYKYSVGEVVNFNFGGIPTLGTVIARFPAYSAAQYKISFLDVNGKNKTKTLDEEKITPSAESKD
jgi:hypothetical protein